MDFKKLREEAQKLKNKAQNAGKNALEYGASKIADSKVMLKTLEELKEFQEASHNTSKKNPETGENKEFVHRALLIVADVKSDFFQSLLYKLPILQTKAFSQSVKIKLLDTATP